MKILLVVLGVMIIDWLLARKEDARQAEEDRIWYEHIEDIEEETGISEGITFSALREEMMR